MVGFGFPRLELNLRVVKTSDGLAQLSFKKAYR